MIGNIIWGTVVFVCLGVVAAMNWQSVKNLPRGESRGVNTVLAVTFTGLALVALLVLIRLINDAGGFTG